MEGALGGDELVWAIEGMGDWVSEAIREGELSELLVWTLGITPDYFLFFISWLVMI